MKKYPAYKPSGIDWLGDIPEGWSTKKVKYLFKLETNPAPKHNSKELLSIYTDIGVRPRKDLEQKGNKASTTDGYWVVKKGDLIVNKLLAWMGAIGCSNYEGVTSPAYDILSPRENTFSWFFHYLFRTKICQTELKKRSRGIMEMRLRLYFSEFGDIKVPNLSFPEQQQIASFLDKKTAQIDTLIEKKQKMLELLKEKRTAIINHAVTKGLNPNVKMKPSGIDWLGDIPEGWKVKPLKTLLKKGKEGIKIGPFGSSLKLEMMAESGFKVYGQENIIKDDFKVGQRYIDDQKFRELEVYEIKTGDIVVTMMGTTGKCKVIPTDFERGIMDSHLIRLRVSKKIIPNLVSLLINDSYYLFTQLKLNSKGSIMEGLNSAIIKSLSILLPPLPEQQQIATFLDKKTAQIDKFMEMTNKQIELLKEYRTTLISDVVTGKVDVRDEVTA